jgi:hypothetical protein
MSSKIERLTELLMDGASPDDAVRQLQPELDDLHLRKIEWLVRFPDLTRLPSAQCLAANLPVDRTPTRKEIDRAIAICLKQE